jgi:hypothetical protein
MLNTGAVRYEYLSRDTFSYRIIPFQKKSGPFYVPNTTSEGFSLGLINSRENNTKETMEALIYEIFIKEKLLDNEKEINPFGSVYLCNLQPDGVDYSRIEKIKLFENITDISDSISFNDGMDD